MAKFEHRLYGNFDAVLEYFDHGIIDGSLTASYEDGSDYSAGDVRCAVRVYERYSMLGKNRVSMSLTLVGAGENLFLSAITSGGSQAMFVKWNTLGESTFLNKVMDLANRYTGM